MDGWMVGKKGDGWDTDNKKELASAAVAVAAFLVSVVDSVLPCLVCFVPVFLSKSNKPNH